VTQRLYQADAYATTFESRVVSVTPHEGRYLTELEATLFYPESGGQPADTGTIEEVRIEDALDEGSRVLHVSSVKPGFGPGDVVRGEIDWPRRLLNMQQHTGQHILSQAFLRVLDAATVSSRLGLEHSTIDVARLDLSWEDMEKVEQLANSVVYEDRPVETCEVTRDETADLRMKRPVDREVLRIVEVDDFDRSPCGGTHCRRSGEVGLVKILRWEKVRDTTRVEFMCGVLAEADYFWKSRFIVELAQDLTTKDANIPAQVRGMIEDQKDLRKQVEALRRRLLANDAAELAARAEEMAGTRVVAAYLEDKSPSEVRELAARLTGDRATVALLAAGGERAHFVFSRSKDVGIDMRVVIKAACEAVGGKGGGRPEVCEGGGKNMDQVAAALEQSRQVLADLLGGQRT
jgi:alanyl-tRNA synthetase